MLILMPYLAGSYMELVFVTSNTVILAHDLVCAIYIFKDNVTFVGRNQDFIFFGPQSNACQIVS